MLLNLPQPDDALLAHHRQVHASLQAEIEASGPIPFVRYMQQALYAPGLGYYRAGAYKLGAKGDFVTAPELSPLFSHCVAEQCRHVLQAFSGGEEGDILELGAGSGVMALEILRELRRRHHLPRHYYLLEVSADLRWRQQELLKQEPELFSLVRWLDRLPDAMQGIIVANEVLDAMPVNKIKRTPCGWQEFYVNHRNAAFQWELGELSSTPLQAAVDALDRNLAVGYESEINLHIPGWIAGLSHALQRGAILLIDYGFPRREYYHPDRHMGTLMCHYQHRAHADPLILTGIQDITAHVDFTAVAEAAVLQGLEIAGFTHQAAFLINCGIMSKIMRDCDSAEKMRQNNQVKQLMLPSEMGELFKVMALTKRYDEPLCGFTTLNQTERL